jgi:diaminopimelate decarboxylase
MFSLIKNHLLQHSFQRQQRKAIRDLSLWDLEVNDRGHVSIGGLDTVDLLKTFGSPLLVVHHRNLVRHAREMLDALSIAPPGSRVYYSYKTNCVPGILRELHEMGIGAEVISPFELWLANKLGVAGDSVIYNGVDKTEESIELAIQMGIRSINFDYASEVDRVARVAQRRNSRVGVGIRLGLSERAQFGFAVDNGESLEVCRRILQHQDVFDFRCVHFNVTSNSKSSADNRWALARALDFVDALHKQLGVCVQVLDIGGGFGVPTTKNLSHIEYLLYRGIGLGPAPPNPQECQPIRNCVEDLVSDIRKAAESRRFPMPAIAVEPGRFITSRSEVLLTKINSIKERPDGVPFALTDAGRLSITFPCEFEYHEVFVPNRPLAPAERPYMVMGRVCTSADWLFRNRFLPELRQDDLLAIMDAGAYFSSYSSNFAFPRPAIVMVKDGSASVIRSAESFEHLTAMDTVLR